MTTNTKFNSWCGAPSYNVIIREADISYKEEDTYLVGNEDFDQPKGPVIGTYSINLTRARELIKAFYAVKDLHYKNNNIYYVQAAAFGCFTILSESDEYAVCRTKGETLISPEKKIGDDIYHGSVWFQLTPKDYTGLTLEFEIPIYAIIKWVAYFDKHENN